MVLNLYDVLRRTASRNPEAPALGFRESMMTYGELLTACERFAGGLVSLGLCKGSRVALLLPNCPQFAIAYLGAGLAGVTLVPVNVLCKPDEVLHILDDSEVDAVIAVEPFRPMVQAFLSTLPKLQHAIIVSETGVGEGEVDFQSLLVADRPPVTLERSTGEDVAVIIYTSGTTGRPKGAMLTHRNIIANAESASQVLTMGLEDCCLSALPLFHSFAATVFLVLPILTGARSQLIERFMPTGTLQMIEQVGATVFGGVPSMFDLMLEAMETTKPDMSALRLCICGGAPLPPEVCRLAGDAFDTTMVEGYGLTEASPVVAVNPPFGVKKIGSVGPAIPGVEIRVVNDEGCDVSTGEVGELLVRGDNVMKGYLHKPEETAKVLVDGWLYTGDLARLDTDGYIYIVGRKKELIIVGGMNVYPGEVERVLVEHPAVLEVAAFGVPDSTRGEAVWSAVVLSHEAQVSGRELQTFCRERLAPYKVPRRIEIRTSLPKNALGKVMRHVLREEISEVLAASAVVARGKVPVLADQLPVISDR